MESIIEKDVQQKYEGIKIQHPSLTAHAEHKFMAGSPDGVAEWNGERFLLEFKAPYTLYLEEKPAIDANFVTTDTKGQTTLKRQNNYFYQVQGLLDIFDLPFCIFVVAGFDDFLYIRIDRELDFFATRMFTQLESFYFGAVLPELTFPMKRRGGLRTALVPFLER